MQFRNVATGVGSLPHTDAAAGCEEVLRRCPRGPYWPTFPKLDVRENMYAQCSEGLPRVLFDEQRQAIVFDCEGDLTDDLTAFYERIVSEDLDHFAYTPDYARGLYYLLDSLAGGNRDFDFVKGEITGPFSFGLTVSDTSGRPILFHDEMADAVIQGLALKARWQTRKLAELGPPVVIFVDEPYFASLGSAYVPIGRDQAVPMVAAIVDAIHVEGGIAGIHCCGNTDWSAVIEAGVDIISFDAYSYFEGLSLYTEELKCFLSRGGTLAWGIVPTRDGLFAETVDTLRSRLEQYIESLVDRGLPESALRSSMLLTPSCGLGTVDLDSAHRAMEMTSELAGALDAVAPPVR